MCDIAKEIRHSIIVLLAVTNLTILLLGLTEVTKTKLN
jgi:hypothetical protein